MADARDPWQESDFVINHALPPGRLVRAWTLNTLCIVIYEREGYGRSEIIAAFIVDREKATQRWTGAVLDRDIVNLGQPKKAIEEGAVVKNLLL